MESQSELSDLIEKIGREADSEGFVPFLRVSRELLHQSPQYSSRYVGGLDEYPNLGEGLRFKSKSEEWADISIHKDDIGDFVARVKKYRKETGRSLLYND